jgi:hypothetical protein
VWRRGNTRCSAAERAGSARRAQARRQAQAIESSLRLERLSQQAGGSMVTTKSLASMDEEGVESEGVLQRLNIILKARAAAAARERCPSAQAMRAVCLPRREMAGERLSPRCVRQYQWWMRRAAPCAGLPAASCQG